jgi:hypothetical protein
LNACFSHRVKNGPKYSDYEKSFVKNLNLLPKPGDA